MAGQTWCITISGSPASFVPDVYSESDPPPTGLQAQAGDLVSWNNQSGQEHQPWLTDADHVLQGTSGITEIIAPWDTSTPGYILAGTAPSTIYYRCALHPDLDEFGTIDLVV